MSYDHCTLLILMVMVNGSRMLSARLCELERFTDWCELNSQVDHLIQRKIFRWKEIDFQRNL